MASGPVYSQTDHGTIVFSSGEIWNSCMNVKGLKFSIMKSMRLLKLCKQEQCGHTSMKMKIKNTIVWIQEVNWIIS